MTQEDMILTHLQAGKTITSLEALDLYKCFRLASRISDIRKHYPDLNIQVSMIHNDLTHKHYASYFLAKEEVFKKEETGQMVMAI